ncbi:hypothetical protein NE619_17765 [Anaerovorax odorimutans]|uniref:Large polyvalent protein associated domain-containing protein n=1 Tax=Anaerovorax odorimutans TaxID=109327 RepID=A0ABT1RTP5_9FIRM|nr:hypothetical protein [Anaerovorax odorimutans]MCQ4638579.1 hypothetical protein [Anaerovorax odorimutans]
MKYECIKSFDLPRIDEYGEDIGDYTYTTIREGSVWEIGRDAHFADIRLYTINTFEDESYWIDITKEQLNACFKEVEDD